MLMQGAPPTWLRLVTAVAGLTLVIATLVTHEVQLVADDPSWARSISGGPWQDGVFQSAPPASFEEEVDLTSRMLELRPGMTYCEVGAANGLWATALARKVMPGGRLIATVGTAEEMPVLRASAASASIPASVARGREFASGLPQDESCDAIMSRMVFFFIEQPDYYARDFFAALKPGGKMLVTDHGEMQGMYKGPRGVDSFMKLTLATEQADFEAAGFRLLKQMNWTHFYTKGFANLLTKDVTTPS